MVHEKPPLNTVFCYGRQILPLKDLLGDTPLKGHRNRCNSSLKRSIAAKVGGKIPVHIALLLQSCERRSEYWH